MISFNIRRSSHGWQSISKSFEIRRRSLIWQAELPLGHGLKVPWKNYLKSRGIQWNCFLRDRSYAPLAFQPSLVIAIQIKSPWPADKAILVSVISSREFRCCIAIGKNSAKVLSDDLLVAYRQFRLQRILWNGNLNRKLHIAR